MKLILHQGYPNRREGFGAMNLYKIEQLKAEAIARCKKRLELHGRSDPIVPYSPAFSPSLRKKHGL